MRTACTLPAQGGPAPPSVRVRGGWRPGRGAARRVPSSARGAATVPLARHGHLAEACLCSSTESSSIAGLIVSSAPVCRRNTRRLTQIRWCPTSAAGVCAAGGEPCCVSLAIQPAPKAACTLGGSKLDYRGRQRCGGPCTEQLGALRRTSLSVPHAPLVLLSPLLFCSPSVGNS